MAAERPQLHWGTSRRNVSENVSNQKAKSINPLSLGTVLCHKRRGEKQSLSQNGQAPGKWVGNGAGKQDGGISVAPVPFQSPAEAVRELQLCDRVTEPRGAGHVWGVCTRHDLCLFSVFIPGQLPLLKIPNARYPAHGQITMNERR